MHSMLSGDGKESNTAKGVDTATDFNEFKDSFFNQKVLRQKMKRFQSKKHKMGTCKINKTSASCFDDKRFFSNDGIHTHAYFHKNLRKQIHTDDHKVKGIPTDKRDSKRFS